jgi:hypothetical protein
MCSGYFKIVEEHDSQYHIGNAIEDILIVHDSLNFSAALPVGSISLCKFY